MLSLLAATTAGFSAPTGSRGAAQSRTVNDFRFGTGTVVPTALGGADPMASKTRDAAASVEPPDSWRFGVGSVAPKPLGGTGGPGTGRVEAKEDFRFGTGRNDGRQNSIDFRGGA